MPVVWLKQWGLGHTKLQATKVSLSTPPRGWSISFTILLLLEKELVRGKHIAVFLSMVLQHSPQCLAQG